MLKTQICVTRPQCVNQRYDADIKELVLTGRQSTAAGIGKIRSPGTKRAGIVYYLGPSAFRETRDLLHHMISTITLFAEHRVTSQS